MPARFVEVVDVAEETQNSVEKIAQVCRSAVNYTTDLLNNAADSLHDRLEHAELLNVINTSYASEQLNNIYEEARRHADVVAAVQRPPSSVLIWFLVAVILVAAREVAIRILVRRRLKRFGMHAH